MRKETTSICLHLLLVVVVVVIGGSLQLAGGELLDICSQEADGTRLPLSSHCGRFVVCQEREIASIGNCPRGLHFNRLLGECDFQWRANCLSLSAFGIPDDSCSCSCCASECNELEFDEEVTKKTSTTCAPNDKGSTEPFITDVPQTDAPQTDDPSTDAPETDDPSTDAPATDDPSTDAPETDDPSTDVTVTDGPGVTTTPSGGSSKPTTSTTPGTVPSYCSDSRTNCANQPDGAMLPVDGECGKFIQCAHGCVQEFSCPGNLYFDPVYNVCNYAYLVDCTPSSDNTDNIDPDTVDDVIVGPSGTTCSSQSVCAKQPDGKMFANPDTNGYFVCQCQCPIAMPCDELTKFNETAQVCDWDRSSTGSDVNNNSDVICPGDLVYNATSNECDYPEGYVPEVACNSTSTICQNQTEGALFPVDGVCNKFYKCNYNCAVEQNCPNNLIYDSKTKICDYPQNVKCEWDYVAPSGPSAGPSGTACESNGRCLGQREGTLFPSLTSCNGYVVCQCECEVELSCSDGLYWDQDLSTCNYSNKVDCTL